MMEKKTKEDTPTSLSWCQRSHLILRGRKKKKGSIRGKLRIRSMPGMFVVLGVLVVVVGTTLAVVGYWPFRLTRASILEAAEKGSFSQSLALGAKGLLSSAPLVHSERMKLLGPVIMGVGLFILICANTVLYENRDRETQMMLARMHSVICSVSAAVPSADLKEIVASNAMNRHCQWVSSLPAAHVNILRLQQTTRSEPLLQSGRSTEKEDLHHQEVQQTEVLHHQQSESSSSIHSSNSDCNHSPPPSSSQPERDRESSFSPQGGPYVRTQAGLTSSSSLASLQRNDSDAPVPRRCHSMSHRTHPGTPTSPPPTEGHLQGLPPNGHPADRGGGACPKLLSLPVHGTEGGQGRIRQSWPRVDFVTSRRYLNLENRGDLVDKVLDQLELQASHWDQGFGSGPFQ